MIVSQRAPAELVIPVDEQVELRLVHPQMGREMSALIQANFDHISPWLPWTANAGSKEFAVTMNLAMEHGAYVQGRSYPMAIFAEGQLAGAVDIRTVGPSGEAEIGYWLDKDWTGKGIATRSAACLIEFARGRHHIPLITISTHKDNVKSIGVAERLGFTPRDTQSVNVRRFVRTYE